jgi:ATP-dependent Zn protease
LTKEKKTLEKVAKVLIEKETIEREEFEMLIGQKEKLAKKTVQKVSVKAKKKKEA